MQRRWVLLAFLLVALAGGFLVGIPRAEELPGKRPLVVATLFPYYDLARIIAGEEVEVRLLFPFGVGPHEAVLTPAAAQLLGRADLLISNGARLEPTAEKFSSLLGSGAASLIVSDAVEVVDGNPHVWLDPVAMSKIAAAIRDGLIRIDPAHAVGIQTRAEALLRQLKDLHQDYTNELGALPNKTIVVFHDAFAPLARRYGLTVAATFEEFPGKEPSSRELAGIIEKIRKHRVRVLFAEPQFSPKLVEAIARDLHLEVTELDPLETAQETDSYVALMKKNLASLAGALGPTEAVP